jgi:hypothetical protein
LPVYPRLDQIYNEELAKHPGHNGISDAVRHAEASRRVYDEFGPLIAWSSGAGHEALDWLMGSPFRETLMDLHNNMEGRAAAREGRPINPGNLRVNPQQSNGDYP